MLSPEILDSIAQAAHEVNQAYCQFTGMVMGPWAECSAAHRTSLRRGVLGIVEGHFKGPEQQHESWLDLKIEEGWTYGPEKNEALKTHPCLVPYRELPKEQRLKDSLFRAVVLQSARMLGLEVIT
jgi:hypothetical protein